MDKHRERSYTPSLVERLLRSYIDFQHYLLGEGGRTSEPNPMVLTQVRKRERPLGMGPNDPRPWPFRELARARIPRDGKRKARQMLEIHMSMLDLEAGLKRLDNTDLALIYQYFLVQNRTLDELAAAAGITRGSMSRRCQGALERLTMVMEYLY